MAAGKQQEVVPPPPVAANTDEESQTVVQSKSSHSNRKKWVLITSLVLIFITVDTVVFLTLDRIFFGVRTPECRLQSVTIQNLRVSNSSSDGSAPTSPPPPSLNMQLNGEVTLMNRNLFGTYRFHDEYLTFSYGDKSIGEAVITGTRVNARSTKTVAFFAMNVTAKAGSRNSIKMTAFSELRGQVRVLNLFPKNKSAKLNCDLSVNFAKEIVEDLICH